MNNRWIKQNFYDLKYIAKGAYGKVYKAYRRGDNQIVAIKQAKIIPNMRETYIGKLTNMLAEVEILEYLSKPECPKYISCYYDHHLDNNRRILYVIMEYIEGQDLDEYINQFSLDSPERLEIGRKVMLAISTALVEIHNKGIIHRDIKPSNIRVSSDFVPILIDFGLSCRTRDYSPDNTIEYSASTPNLKVDYKNTCSKSNIANVARKDIPCCIGTAGTPLYMAPENDAHVQYPQSDMWSLGATVYLIITGQSIWGKPNSYNELQRMWASETPDKLNTSDVILNAAVNGVLNKPLAERLTASQVVNLLKLDDK